LFCSSSQAVGGWKYSLTTQGGDGQAAAPRIVAPELPLKRQIFLPSLPEC
jgi:hypothetical protein